MPHLYKQSATVKIQFDLLWISKQAPLPFFLIYNISNFEGFQYFNQISKLEVGIVGEENGIGTQDTKKATEALRL